MTIPQEQLRAFVERFFAQKERWLGALGGAASPLYLLDAEAFRERARRFRRTFETRLPDCAFYFALKSNNHPRVAGILLGEGLGLDVSGAPELETALDLGAVDMLLSGPGKVDAELELAAEHAERVTVLLDSFSELERLEKIAEARKTTVRAGVRLSTDPEGLWGKFGIPLGVLPAFLRQARNCSRVALLGLQFHTSWNMSPQPQCDFLAALGRVLREIPTAELAPLGFLDVGGGYWPEAGEWLRDESRHPLIHSFVPATSLDAYAQALATAVPQCLGARWPCRVAFEPGRWICNDAMHLLLTVVDIKASDLVIVDAGTNAVGWERFENDYCPVLNLTRPSLDEKACRILGSLCTPHDVFGYSYFGEDIRPGDRLLIPRQGAYTYSLAQRFIKPVPRVVEL